MNLLSPVRTIMTNHLQTLHPKDELRKVKDIFEAKRIHHIPVVEDGILKGIISKSDYLFFCRGFKGINTELKVERYRLNNHRVEEIMTTGLATMNPDDKINVALEIFKVNLFHAIPIVEDGLLIGIVTTYDIIENLANDKIAENKYV